MPPAIRPFTPADENAVTALLDAVWAHDPTMRGVYAFHRAWQSDLLRQTLVAEEGGEVVGVGTVFESTFHPQHLLTALHVAPGRQRQGIGSAMWAALTALSDGRDWSVKLSTRDEAGKAFFARRGFTVAVDSFSGRLDATSQAVQAWAAELPPADIVPWDGENPAEIAHAIEALYARHHQWSAPRPLTDEEAIGRFLTPSLPWSVISAMKGGQRVGVGCLWGTEEQPVMVFVGALTPEHEGVTPGLIRWLVEAAAERGLSLSFEADDVMETQWALYESAPTDEASVDLQVWAGPHNT